MSDEVYVKCEICGEGFDNYPSLIAHLYQHIKRLREENKMLEANILKLQGALEEAEKHMYRPPPPSYPHWRSPFRRVESR